MKICFTFIICSINIQHTHIYASFSFNVQLKVRCHKFGHTWKALAGVAKVVQVLDLSSLSLVLYRILLESILYRNNKHEMNGDVYYEIQCVT